MRSSTSISIDIAEARGGSVVGDECIFCDKHPNRKVGSMPICNRCYKIHHLLNEYQAAL